MAREAKIKLEADASGFKSSVTGAANHMKKNSEKIQASWNKVQNRTSSVIRGFRNLALVGGAVVASFIAIIKTSANTGDAFQKMALRTGASTEFLSGMSHVIQLAGGNLGTLETAIRLLSKRMLDVDSGLGEAKRSFERLGISVHDSEGNLRAIEEIFPAVLKAFGELTNETEKVALAQELFGRSGTQLLPLIDQGTAAIKAQMAEAKALGLVWSQDATDAAAEFNDMQTRLIGGFKGIKDSISQALFPVFIEWMKDGTERMKEFIKNDLPGFVQRVEERFKAAVPKIESFVRKLGDIGAFLIEHGDIIGKILVVATIAFVIVKLGLLASAIGGLVLATAGLTFTPAGALLVGLGLLGAALAAITLNADEASGAVTKLSGLGTDAKGNFEGTNIPARFGTQGRKTPTISDLGGFKHPPLPTPKAPPRPSLELLPESDMEGDIKGLEDAIIGAETELDNFTFQWATLGEEMGAGIRAGLEDFTQAIGSNFDIMRRAAFNFIGSTRQNFSNFFRGMADESTTASEVWSQLWADSKATAVGALSEILIDFATKKVLEVALHGTAEAQKTELSQKGTLARIALSVKEIGSSLLSAAASMLAAIAAGFKWLVTTLGPFGLAAGIALGAGLIAAFSSLKGQLGFQRGGLIPRYAMGGLIIAGTLLPSSLVQGTDSLLIRTTPGEYVVREQVVRQYGANSFDEFNKTGDITALIRSLPGRQSGGIVGRSDSVGNIGRSNRERITVNLYFKKEQNREDAEYIRQVVDRELLKILNRKARLRESS